MSNIKVLVTIPKKVNHIWKGQGELIGDRSKVTIQDGIVIVKMLTGQRKGSVGGFDVTGLRFKTVRTNVFDQSEPAK